MNEENPENYWRTDGGGENILPRDTWDDPPQVGLDVFSCPEENVERNKMKSECILDCLEEFDEEIQDERNEKDDESEANSAATEKVIRPLFEQPSKSAKELLDKIEIDKRNFNIFVEHYNFKYFSWGMMLVLEAMGRVFYATRGQLDRFLIAWRRNFEPDVEVKFVVSKLIKMELLGKTRKPVRFTRGRLKGHRLPVYHLTKKGRKMLVMRGIKNADKARASEPTGKLFDNLQHELLVTEIYVHYIETARYIYDFLGDAAHRREIAANPSLWAPREEGFYCKTIREISDLIMSYFDAENDLPDVVNAEAAVRYTEKQIRAKGKHYDWFCYDKREADKIRRVTGITATILDEGLLAEARGDFKLRRGERSDVKYINKTLVDCIESLGGLTVYNAAKFLGITPQTVIPKLKKAAIATQVNLSLYKRFRAGRPRTLYIPKTAKNDFSKQRDALMLNLVLELLFQRDNLKIEMTGRELNIETKATGRKFQLICDSSFMRDSWTWDETLKETRRKILEGERQNKATIIAATIYIDAEIYKANFPKAYVLDLDNPPR